MFTNSDDCVQVLPVLRKLASLPVSVNLLQVFVTVIHYCYVLDAQLP